MEKGNPYIQLSNKFILKNGELSQQTHVIDNFKRKPIYTYVFGFKIVTGYTTRPKVHVTFNSDTIPELKNYLMVGFGYNYSFSPFPKFKLSLSAKYGFRKWDSKNNCFIGPVVEYGRFEGSNKISKNLRCESFIDSQRSSNLDITVLGGISIKPLWPNNTGVSILKNELIKY